MGGNLDPGIKLSAGGNTRSRKAHRGALVAGVIKDGPADRGGIKLGDVILEYDGKPVTDALDLPLLIARTPIAKRVGVKIQRDREEIVLDLTVAELPEIQFRVGNQIG